MATTRNVDTAAIPNPETTTLRLVRSNPNGFLSREQVLDAAEACFDAGGYDGVTIRAIAKQLGCSVGAIYRYFDDKRAMLLTLADRLFKPALDAAAGPDGLVRSTQRWLEIAEQRPDLYRLIFLVGSPEPPAVALRLVEQWGKLLKSPMQAQRRFAYGHGLLMLGHPAEFVAAAIETVPTPPAWHISVRRRNPRETPVEVAAQPTATGDDVTLL